ncbi:hypothetical protein AvCA_23560 [Azotobacter vinelandii CA]|uniref:Uncharacterized protein n=2 Tax=Azotobacter vinelandii TaxID=354 RepID=C1DHE9_AZOVD|nr:hypothetical protein Avin_23560 [Azotobacter vinelandii DJ]AGK16697.1 hypothetical protein AvCA_23560 [Azotobacter vinelandii CA]AGK20578.1 hypothetical protein AvCA6_23560 [Azotobacter vinelandii CA6]
MNILVGILGLKEQQLSDNQVRHVVFYLANHEYYSLLQETRINIVSTLTASGLFDHHRYQATSGLDFRHLHEMISHVLIAP